MGLEGSKEEEKAAKVLQDKFRSKMSFRKRSQVEVQIGNDNGINGGTDSGQRQGNNLSILSINPILFTLFRCLLYFPSSLLSRSLPVMR